MGNVSSKINEIPQLKLKILTNLAMSVSFHVNILIKYNKLIYIYMYTLNKIILYLNIL